MQISYREQKAIKCKAELKIQVILDCPHCENEIDLLSDEFWHLNDECEILRTVIKDNRFGCENLWSELGDIDDATCPHCDGKFIVEKVW